MSFMGTLIVRVDPGSRKRVRSRLTTMAGAEIVGEAGPGFAVLLEADTAKQQEKRHREIASWFGVREALVVFQGRGDDDDRVET